MDEIYPTKHIILTFNDPNLTSRIKAAYLSCAVQPYIPNPLRCFKCQHMSMKKILIVVVQKSIMTIKTVKMLNTVPAVNVISQFLSKIGPEKKRFLLFKLPKILHILMHINM